MKIFVFTAVLFAGISAVFAAADIKLPPPDLQSGKPLMQCLALRRSSRNFDRQPLPMQIISEILFAADGINRADGHKTVPTALNKQNQTIYAVTSDGVYHYNNQKHSLVLIQKGDFRKNCGMQPFHQTAPLILVYVSDMAAVGNTPEQQAMYAGNHSGSASQNVYLYAASKGLSTVICGSINKELLKKTLHLKGAQQAVFSQPIGFPGK